jgi:hypothetical protein
MRLWNDFVRFCKRKNGRFCVQINEFSGTKMQGTKRTERIPASVPLQSVSSYIHSNVATFKVDGHIE